MSSFLFLLYSSPTHFSFPSSLSPLLLLPSPELTALSRALPCVGNCHAAVLQTHGVLTFLFRILPGVCERSFGIHVAEMAGFPPHVVALAQQKLREFEGEESDEKQDADTPQLSIQPAAPSRARESIDEVVDSLSHFDIDNSTTDQALSLLTTLASD